MSLLQVSPGKNPPEVFNVVIEIPAQSDPVKYEVDKETGLLMVDHDWTVESLRPWIETCIEVFGPAEVARWRGSWSVL